MVNGSVFSNLNPEQWTIYTTQEKNELVKILKLAARSDGNLKGYNKFWMDTTIYMYNRWIFYPWRQFGILFLILGFSLGIGSAFYFRKLGTHLRPGTEANLIVTSGPFKYTRNPMYIGFILALIATAILLGAFSPTLVIPVFIMLIQKQFILMEEKMMERSFGQTYLEYKMRTPRSLI